MAKKLVSVMNTAFRDGFQSVYGARVFTDDFLPAVEAAERRGGGGVHALLLLRLQHNDETSEGQKNA